MDIITELSRLIGVEPSIKLGQFAGGARIYVPIAAPKDHLLTLILGTELAQKVCDYFSGDTIELPNKLIFRNERNRLIRRDYYSETRGNKANLIAMKYGLSRRQVLNIIRAG